MKIGIYCSHKNRGPGKVIDNLIKGFNILGVSFSINADGDRNIIAQNSNRLNHCLNGCFLGPNISVLPIDSDALMSHHRYEKCIVPSEWVKKLYSRWIPENKITIWPAGIDTDFFCDKSRDIKEFDCLIYFKRRREQDLKFIENCLQDNRQTYHTIKYGNYIESDFIKLISKSRYGIVVDNCESQGIAIQEMMSCNLPLLIWDVNYWTDRGQPYKTEATSAPYWDDACGIKVYNENEVNERLSFFISQKNYYNPRKYILDNLTLDKCANKIYNKLRKT